MSLTTVMIPDSRKETECLKGEPCETNYVRFKVKTGKITIPLKPADSVYIQFNPETQVDEIDLTVTSQGNTSSAGFLPVKGYKCPACKTLTGSILESMKRRKDLTDAEFKEKFGKTRNEAYSYMLAAECNNIALDPTKFVDTRLPCNRSFLYQTGIILVDLVGRMKIRTYGNDCTFTETTITDTIPAGQLGPFSWTIQASEVGEVTRSYSCGTITHTHFNTTISLPCPCYDGKVICGACYYEKVPGLYEGDPMTTKASCMDLANKQMVLGDFPDTDNAFSDRAGKNKSPIFSEVESIRKKASTELVSLVEKTAQSLAAKLVAQAQEISKDNCGTSYKLESIDCTFTKKKIK